MPWSEPVTLLLRRLGPEGGSLRILGISEQPGQCWDTAFNSKTDYGPGGVVKCVLSICDVLGLMLSVQGREGGGGKGDRIRWRGKGLGPS